MNKKLDPQNLLNFVNCLAYVYHPDNKEIITDSLNDSDYIKKSILSKDLQQINNILPVISTEFNVLQADLLRSLYGDRKPLEKLLSAARLIMSANEYKSLKSKFLPNNNNLKRKPVSDSRTDLRCYIHCLAYLQHHTLQHDAKIMGTTQNHLAQVILYKPDDEVLNALQQLPFILSTSMKDIKAILSGNTKPLVNLMPEYSKKVTDLSSLRRFVNAVAYLFGTNIKELSRQLGYSENYIGTTISNGIGNSIAKVFDKISNKLGLSNVVLMSALARANPRVAGHAYFTHMHFVTHYRHSPIQYKERHSKHLMDHKRISRGYDNVRKYIGRNNQKHLRKAVHQIIKGWSNVYGFYAREFMNDNFKNFYNYSKPVGVKQGDMAYYIRDDHDWLVILKKIKHQLRATKHAFNLSKVQDSQYRRYIYIGSIGRLDNPETKYARRGLAKLNELGHDRYTFVGSFENTGVKSVRHGKKPWQEYYRPIIEFKNIRYNGRIIADNVCFNYSKGFINLNHLEPGDLVTFSARVHKYYVGHITKRSVKIANYDLYYPTQVAMKRRIHARISRPVPKELHALIGYCILNNHTAGYDFSYRNYPYVRQCITDYKNWRSQHK